MNVLCTLKRTLAHTSRAAGARSDTLTKKKLFVGAVVRLNATTISNDNNTEPATVAIMAGRFLSREVANAQSGISVSHEGLMNPSALRAIHPVTTIHVLGAGRST